MQLPTNSAYKGNLWIKIQQNNLHSARFHLEVSSLPKCHICVINYVLRLIRTSLTWLLNLEMSSLVADLHSSIFHTEVSSSVLQLIYIYSSLLHLFSSTSTYWSLLSWGEIFSPRSSGDLLHSELKSLVLYLNCNFFHSGWVFWYHIYTLLPYILNKNFYYHINQGISTMLRSVL
jgi:hypothetical protein